MKERLPSQGTICHFEIPLDPFLHYSEEKEREVQLWEALTRGKDPKTDIPAQRGTAHCSHGEGPAQESKVKEGEFSNQFFTTDRNMELDRGIRKVLTFLNLKQM